MPYFNIIKENIIDKKSFRVAQIYDQFDLQENNFKEEFSGNIELPEKWNIGLIVGKSGTGKSLIGKELFGKYFTNFKYKNNCVIDDFRKSIDPKELFQILSKVGFSSPPSWLKPYKVLSNGEKMRIDLARALCDEKEIIVFDEFTSVVDREIAKIGSLAVQKIIRKLNKKFIAITCHYDVESWLSPNWIFCTDDMQIQRRLLRRSKIKIEIRKEKGYWKYFRRYHYLNHDIVKHSMQYVGFIQNKPIAFCAVINYPHPKIKPMWKIHRIVVIPDYQGIGIGMKILNFVADIFNSKKQYIGITTSLKGFAKGLIAKKQWILISQGNKNKNSGMSSLNKTTSLNRNTYSFRYCPKT